MVGGVLEGGKRTKPLGLGLPLGGGSTKRGRMLVGTHPSLIVACSVIKIQEARVT